MSMDLILKQSCDGCGSTVELYGSTCKHLTLCLDCGKSMAEKRSNCCECGTSITCLIREYNVRASPNNGKDYAVGRFVKELPNFKKNENGWSLWTGLQGRQVTDSLRKNYKFKPWLLEHEGDQIQYIGQFVGSAKDMHYLLLPQGKEFVAILVDSWYMFNIVNALQRKQVTLEKFEKLTESRMMMVKRLYKRAATFREGKKFATIPNWGVEEDEEATPKCTIGIKRQSGDDDGECLGGGDFYYGDNMKKGEDWDYEEISSSDDERDDPEEEEALVTKIRAYSEVQKDAENDEFEIDVEYEGLSESGKEMKKLLDRLDILDYDDYDDEDEDEDVEDEHETDGVGKSGKEMKKLDDDSDGMVHKTYLALVEEFLKREPADKSNHPLNPCTSKSLRRRNGEESKTPNDEPLKRVKTENLR